jgi:hypothetical protein
MHRFGNYSYHMFVFFFFYLTWVHLLRFLLVVVFILNSYVFLHNERD